MTEEIKRRKAGKNSEPEQKRFELMMDSYIRGIRPLLQNAMVGPEKADVVGKVGEVYDDTDEAVKRLIKDKADVICQPAEHLESSMVKAAVEFKFKGQKTYKELFKAGIFVEPLLIPHLIQDWEIDKRWVRIGQARIARCRPRFDQWELKFKVRCLDDRIQPLIVKQVLETAGFYYGIGDYRPRYGLFEVVNFEVI